MKYSDVIALLNETGLSPEGLAIRIAVSNSTYRRWLKVPPDEEFPNEYKANVAAGIYKLLNERLLSYDSKRVNKFLEGNLPEFFQATVGRFNSDEDFDSVSSNHQEKITAVLSNLGRSAGAREQVDKASTNILAFAKWGPAWKNRIGSLWKIINSRKLTLVDRLVAYGALYYLILPFDLIPDYIPVFGFVDDFGILGFAAAYYSKRFPHIVGGHEQL